MPLSEQILSFLAGLRAPKNLPEDVVVLNPYLDETAMALCREFYQQYYADNSLRTLILGINPGRFGGGVTGIPFTDPIRLANVCGIVNNLPKKPELSSEYIYQMIAAYGGAEKFYSRFYISSVSPLGFTLNGKNLNYYDRPELAKSLMPFIVRSLKKQLDYGLRTDICFCLGEGDNYKFITKLNDEHRFFEKIVPLAHPRFILQYRRKTTSVYIADYLARLNAAPTI